MEFKELGLTQNESKAYTILLKTESISASELSKESKVPYGRIYTVLESLESKGLVVVIDGPSKKYSASDPIKLQEIIDNKMKDLMKINDEVKNYKNIYAGSKESVIVAKGKGSSSKIILKEPRQFSYHIKKGIDIQFVKRKLDKNVDLKILAASNEFKIDARKIPNEGAEVSIVDEQVSIKLENTSTTILIKDQAFSKLMKELFIKYYIQSEQLIEDKKK